MRGNIKSFEKPFTHAEVVALADRTLKRFGGDRNKAGRYARSMENRYESSKWAQVVEALATSRHATKKSAAELDREIAEILTAPRGHARVKAAKPDIKFGKFGKPGNAYAEDSIDILVDGQKVGWIERSMGERFASPSSRQRVTFVSHYGITFTDDAIEAKVRAGDKIHLIDTLGDAKRIARDIIMRSDDSASTPVPGVGAAHARKRTTRSSGESQEMRDLREQKAQYLRALDYAGNTREQVKEYHRLVDEISAQMRALPR